MPFTSLVLALFTAIVTTHLLLQACNGGPDGDGATLFDLIAHTFVSGLLTIRWGSQLGTMLAHATIWDDTSIDRAWKEGADDRGATLFDVLTHMLRGRIHQSIQWGLLLGVTYIYATIW